MEFSRQEYGVGCCFLLQGVFLTQGLNPCLLHWQADSLPLSHLGWLVKRIPQLSFLHLTPEFSREYLWEEFPGGLAVKIWCFHFHSLGSILGPETEILQAAEHSQKKFKKRGCLRASVFQLIKWGLPMQFSLHHSPKCCQTQKERGRVDRKDAGTVK